MGVHLGSILCPCLFMMVLEAVLQEYRIGLHWELLYAGDLMVAESLEEAKEWFLQ